MVFTGLIEEIGFIVSKHIVPSSGQTILVISASVILTDIKLGDSIAVNGVCLTATAFTPASFTVGLSPETLRRTTFGSLAASSPVNLERALSLSSHVGGHLVQGHVDCVGRIVSMQRDGDALQVVIAAPQSLLQFVVEKGYIAIDGVSLTVVRVEEGEGAEAEGEDSSRAETEGELEVMLIQYTQSRITLPSRRLGDGVNLEADITGKQIVAFLRKYERRIRSRI